MKRFVGWMTSSSRTNIGELMLANGGGGHDAAGTCQVANVGADLALEDLVARITADESAPRSGS